MIRLGVHKIVALAWPALLACSNLPSADDNPTGAMSISVDVTGVDFPQTFAVRVNAFLGSVKANQRAFLGLLPTGDYNVSLEGLPSNCTAAQASQSVTVEGGNTVEIRFAVTCVATFGVLRVSITTAGVDPDPTGYSLQLSGGQSFFAAANGTYLFSPVLGGSQTVTVDGIATNCSPVSSRTASITVAIGTVTRDTAKATFTLSCTKVQKFAFRRVTKTNNVAFHYVTLSYADGSEVASIADGYAPAWSPDGASLAFTWLDCGYYYYYFVAPCNAAGLATMSVETGRIVLLTKDSSDSDPAWRPDGSVIVFSRANSLFFASSTTPDAALTQLVVPPSLRRAIQPSWSPDGRRLAFACLMDDGRTDICTIAVDGSSFVRLTNDSAIDASPEWSPDGNQIAFSTSVTPGSSEIAVIASTGGGSTRLTTGRNPAWSYDGTSILFERLDAPVGISMITLASGALKRLTTGDDHDPAWRP